MTDDDIIRLANQTIVVGICRRTGALVTLDHVAANWQVLGDGHLGCAFELLVPLPGRRNNPAFGQTSPRVEQSDDSVTLTWLQVTSAHGGVLDISVVQKYQLRDDRLVVDTIIDNQSSFIVENAYSPSLRGLVPPPGSNLTAFHYNYGGAMIHRLWPNFDNTPGYYGVQIPTQLAEGAAVYGTPASPFTVLQAGSVGLTMAVDAARTDLVAWQGSLYPGYADSMDSDVPPAPVIGGHEVALRYSAVHIPFVAPGERRQLTPIAIAPFVGDWHAGVDVYRSRRQTWLSLARAPEWVCEPHSWLQLQMSSPEDDLRLQFADLVDVGGQCAEAGVSAIQLVGYNDGGQDKNNPLHVPDPRLGGTDELRQAIASIQAMGVKVVLFAKFTWADRASDWFRDDLHRLAVKDPYGDYYMHPGYRYETMTQLLDINTRRLVPMCFLDEEYLDLCVSQFRILVDLGADGILFDECLHHSPALTCFDPSHGHPIGAPVYRNDTELIRRFAATLGDDQFLFAGEACYDWELDTYQLSYHRSEGRSHVPLIRYLNPQAQVMTAVTGFDDRNMLNQCLLYRYVISYEPFNFKGRLTDFPGTLAYGRQVDALRTQLRQWLWDGEFTDTVGARVLDSTGRPHHPYAVFRSAVDDSQALVVANYDWQTVTVEAEIDGAGSDRQWRLVDDQTWHHFDGHVILPPRSAAVVIPA